MESITGCSKRETVEYKIEREGEMKGRVMRKLR